MLFRLLSLLRASRHTLSSYSTDAASRHSDRGAGNAPFYCGQVGLGFSLSRGGAYLLKDGVGMLKSVILCNKILSLCLSFSVCISANRQPACAGEVLTCLRMAWKMLKSVILCNKVLAYPLSLSVPLCIHLYQQTTGLRQGGAHLLKDGVEDA